MLSLRLGMRRALPLRPARRRRSRLAAALRLLGLWRQRARDRRALRRADWRMLRDIGITPAEAEREFAKPFWLP